MQVVGMYTCFFLEDETKRLYENSCVRCKKSVLNWIIHTLG